MMWPKVQDNDFVNFSVDQLCSYNPYLIWKKSKGIKTWWCLFGLFYFLYLFIYNIFKVLCTFRQLIFFFLSKWFIKLFICINSGSYRFSKKKINRLHYLLKMFLKLHVIYLFSPHIKIGQSPKDQPSNSLSPWHHALCYMNILPI